MPAKPPTNQKAALGRVRTALAGYFQVEATTSPRGDGEPLLKGSPSLRKKRAVKTANSRKFLHGKSGLTPETKKQKKAQGENIKD